MTSQSQRGSDGLSFPASKFDLIKEGDFSPIKLYEYKKIPIKFNEQDLKKLIKDYGSSYKNVDYPENMQGFRHKNIDELILGGFDKQEGTTNRNNKTAKSFY